MEADRKMQNEITSWKVSHEINVPSNSGAKLTFASISGCVDGVDVNLQNK